MPTLILAPRYSDDSIKLWRASMALGWDVERLSSWRVPDHFAPDEPVIYGEPLFAEAIAEQLGLALVQPADSFKAAMLVCRRRGYARFNVSSWPWTCGLSGHAG